MGVSESLVLKHCSASYQRCHFGEVLLGMEQKGNAQNVVPRVTPLLYWPSPELQNQVTANQESHQSLL